MGENDMNNKDILKQYDETKRKKLTKEERIEIYNRFDGRCGYCGEKINIKKYASRSHSSFTSWWYRYTR